MLRINPTFHGMWRKIGAPLHVTDFISSGLHLPFGVNGPPQPVEIENQFEPEHERLITDRITFMKSSGRIKPVTDRSELVCVHRFAKTHLPAGHIVLHLRDLNAHLARVPASVARVLPIGKDGYLNQKLKPGYWMTKMDLRHGYSHFHMHEDSQKYLGLSWQGVYYKQMMLPFGLSWSTYMFTETMGAVLEYARHAITPDLYAYADDWLVYGATFDEAAANFSRISQLFAELGLSVNVAKCSAEPTQRLDFVGTSISTAGDELRLGPVHAKLVEVMNNVQETMTMESIPVRQLAAIQGQLRSLVKFGATDELLEFPVMLQALKSKRHWGDVVTISRALYAELEEIAYQLETLVAQDQG